MKTFPKFVLSLTLLATPALLLTAQTTQDPNAPAQNTSQLQSQAQQNKAAADSAKAQEKRSKKAANADKNAAKKESKAAKDQKKAADANAAAQSTPQQ